MTSIFVTPNRLKLLYCNSCDQFRFLFRNSSNSNIFERYMFSSFPPSNLSPELYQLHHLFAFANVGRQLIPFLRKLGLNCTEPKSNPAQGTVSTLIFFENVYLELFWFDETSDLAQFDMNAEFNFLDRVDWLETGASPFGFGLSHTTTNNDNFVTATIEGILETDEAILSEQLLQLCPINVANPEEPICYVVSNYVAIRNRLDRAFAITEQIDPQTMGIRQLTHIKLRVISDRGFHTPLANLVAQNFLEIEYRKHPLLELTFDRGNQKKLLDLRPLIPIVLRY